MSSMHLSSATQTKGEFNCWSGYAASARSKGSCGGGGERKAQSLVGGPSANSTGDFFLVSDLSPFRGWAFRDLATTRSLAGLVPKANEFFLFFRMNRKMPLKEGTRNSYHVRLFSEAKLACAVACAVCLSVNRKRLSQGDKVRVLCRSEWPVLFSSSPPPFGKVLILAFPVQRQAQREQRAARA